MYLLLYFMSEALYIKIIDSRLRKAFQKLGSVLIIYFFNSPPRFGALFLLQMRYFIRFTDFKQSRERANSFTVVYLASFDRKIYI